jgi:copper chaperone CopZ
MKKVLFNVEGINCGSCTKKIEEHFSSNTLVNELSVSIEKKEVLICGTKELSNMTLKSELEILGFNVTGMKKA